MKNKFILKIVSVLFIIFLYSYVGSKISAQEIVIASPAPQQTVQVTTNVDKEKKFGIIYPISELGNCADFTACHSYCGRPENKTTCIAFAEKKGFYKKEEESKKRTWLFQMARTELGCEGEKCKRLCEIKENFERCKKFILRYRPEVERAKEVKNQTMIVRAKNLLGCTTPEECKKLCEDINNKQKCSDFFKQLGLRKERQEKERETEREIEKDERKPMPIKRPIEENRMIKPLVTSFPRFEEGKEASISPKPEVETTEMRIIEENSQEVKGVSTEQSGVKEIVTEAFKDFLYFMMYGTSK